MKYCYRWYIQTNNCCYGCIIVSRAYRSRSEAGFDYGYYVNKYGCCDIVKCRHDVGTEQ